MGAPSTFEDALRRLQAGEGEAVEITLGGGDPLEVVLDPEVEDGLLLRAGQDGTLLSRILPPLDAPPAGYPDGAPFIPQRQVTLSLAGHPDRLHLAWFVDGPVTGLVDELVLRSREQGWETRGKPAEMGGDGGVLEVELTKEGLVRTLLGLQSGSFSQVTLIQEVDEEGSQAAVRSS